MSPGLGDLQLALYAAEDELAGGGPCADRLLMQAAVQFAGDIQTGSDRFMLHIAIITARLK